MRASWWWIDRWRKSTAYTDLTLAERGAYRELLDECWLRGGVIPANDRILARIVGATPEEWKSIMRAVLARFESCEGGLRNVTADEVMGQATRRAKNQKNYRDRKRSANAPDNVPDNATSNKADNKPASPSPSPSPSPTTEERKTDYVEPALDPTLLEAAQEVFDYWRKQTKRHAKWTKPRRGFLEARLREEDGTMAERVAALKLAVDGALLDPWFNGSESGRVFLDFDNIFRNKGRDRIEKLQEVARRAKAGEPPPDREDPLPPEESGARELWASVKIELATTLPAHTHRTWFSPTFGHGWLAGLEKTLVVRVPSEEHRKMLRDTFGVQIKEILATHGVKLLQLAVKELQ